MLRMFFFSKDFGDKMVYPLIALFLGTGNQTANVSCAILERLFDDPNMKLWDYDAETLLPNLPTMVTFPNLHNFYEDWRICNPKELKFDSRQKLLRSHKGTIRVSLSKHVLLLKIETTILQHQNPRPKPSTN